MADKTGPYKCTLPPQLTIKAQTELNEDPRTRLEVIESLRKRALANKALKCRTDDHFLIRFLRARKFNVDRAYQLLINYFKIRAENRSVFKDFKPSSIKHVLEAGVLDVLPGRDKEGRKIIFFRPGKWDPEKFPIWDMLRTNVMTMEKLIEDEETQINGIVLIGEMYDLGWNHAKNFERAYAKLMSAVMQDSFPMRFKGMHLINEPAVVDIIFAMIRPFLKEKFQQRMKFHGSDFTDLHKNYIDPELLPEEAGGSKGPFNNKEWQEVLLASEAMFEDMEKYGLTLTDSNISQGTGAGAVAADTAITGTFKKLNVD